MFQVPAPAFDKVVKQKKSIWHQTSLLFEEKVEQSSFAALKILDELTNQLEWWTKNYDDETTKFPITNADMKENYLTMYNYSMQWANVMRDYFLDNEGTDLEKIMSLLKKSDNDRGENDENSNLFFRVYQAFKNARNYYADYLLYLKLELEDAGIYDINRFQKYQVEFHQLNKNILQWLWDYLLFRYQENQLPNFSDDTQMFSREFDQMQQLDKDLVDAQIFQFNFNENLKSKIVAVTYQWRVAFLLFEHFKNQLLVLDTDLNLENKEDHPSVNDLNESKNALNRPFTLKSYFRPITSVETKHKGNGKSKELNTYESIEFFKKKLNTIGQYLIQLWVQYNEKLNRKINTQNNEYIKEIPELEQIWYDVLRYAA